MAEPTQSPRNVATSNVHREPTRSEVPKSDCWDLSSLFPSVDVWQTELAKWESRIADYAKFQGTLGQSASQLRECLTFDLSMERQAERLGTYAFLRTTEDQADSNAQAMKARFQSLAVKCSQMQSFIQPEIHSIPDQQFQALLSDPTLAEFQLLLKRIHRYRPHTLSENEERLLAMQGEMAQTASQSFDNSMMPT